MPAGSRGAHQPRGVVDDVLGRRHSRTTAWQPLDLLAGRDDRDRAGSTSPVVSREDAPLFLGARVLDHHVEHEAIELGLGQRIGAFLLDRVLRREDEQRPLERDSARR